MSKNSKDQEIGKPGPGVHTGAEQLGLAEEVVRKAEIEYQVIFEAMGNATALIEDDLTITLANSEFEKLSGYSREEIEGKKTLDEFLAPHDAREIKDYFSQSGENYNAPPKNYTILFTNKKAEPMEAVVTLTMARDITRRKLVENALKESEAKYRVLFENMINAFAFHKILVDENGRPVDYVFLEVNDAFEKLTGLKRDDVVGKKATEVFPGIEESEFDWIHAYGQVALTGEPIVFEQYSKQLGRWYHATAYSTERGYFVALFLDISERKQAEEATKQSEETFRTLFAEAPGGIWIFRAGKTLMANRAYLNMFGYASVTELEGTSLLDQIAPQCRSQVKENIRSREQGKAPRAYETVGLKKDGSQLPVYIETASIELPDGPAIIGYLTDITERKRAEEELRESFAKLAKTFEQTVESLSSIAEMRDPYTAGHQVRVAKLACEIASELGMSEEQVSAIRTAALIHDLGKIIVPPEILNKPGKLSGLERSFVEAHAQAGYEILKTIDFALPIAEIVLQHHEKLDGSGYPQGLSGDSILKEARVLTVADIVEAMASHRPYRPALPLKTALEEISRHKGTLYDADVVDACLRLFLEKGLSHSWVNQSIDKRRRNAVPSKRSRAG